MIAEDLEDLKLMTTTHTDVHIATSALKSRNDAKRKRKSRSGSIVPHLLNSPEEPHKENLEEKEIPQSSESAAPSGTGFGAISYDVMNDIARRSFRYTVCDGAYDRSSSNILAGTNIGHQRPDDSPGATIVS